MGRDHHEVNLQLVQLQVLLGHIGNRAGHREDHLRHILRRRPVPVGHRLADAVHGADARAHQRVHTADQDRQRREGPLVQRTQREQHLLPSAGLQV